MDKKEHPINKGSFHRCCIQCESKVIIADQEFVGKFDDIEEWPKIGHDKSKIFLNQSRTHSSACTDE